MTEAMYVIVHRRRGSEEVAYRCLVLPASEHQAQHGEQEYSLEESDGLPRCRKCGVFVAAEVPPSPTRTVRIEARDDGKWHDLAVIDGD